MALADYRLCDVCQHKVFYDANLNYTFSYDKEHEGEWKPARHNGSDGASSATDSSDSATGR